MITAPVALARITSLSVIAADRRNAGAHRDLVGAELVERAGDRLDRAMHVGLDDDRQLLGGAGGDLREHLFERAAAAGCGGRVAAPALAEFGDLAGAAFAVDDDEIVAGQRGRR